MFKIELFGDTCVSRAVLGCKEKPLLIGDRLKIWMSGLEMWNSDRNQHKYVQVCWKHSMPSKDSGTVPARYRYFF
jgi:hypothetical protein